jgi:hypothetical protein
VTPPEQAGTAPPAPAAPAPSPGAARGALAWFALALAACLAVYVALSVPGAWFPSAGAKAYSARDLALTRGAGAPDRDAIMVTGTDESGLALITANSDFRSAEYPVIAWSGSGFPEGADVRFLWRTDYAPSKLNSVPVTISSGRLVPVAMTKNPDWVGRVTGIALAVRGPLAEPIRVAGVVARPGGVFGQVADRLREWLAFEGWSGTSINTITGGADVQELPLPALLVAALLVAAAVWLALAWRGGRLAALPAALAVLFLAAWVVLDAQWTWNLARQVDATRAQYGGKDWRERHVAAEDGPLFQFVEKARARLPAAPARVFVVADAAYFRGRAAYYLYPHNVQFDPFRNTLPAAGWLRSGDFVVVYQRRGVAYNADEKKLRLENGETVSAEAVLVEPGAGVFRIL